MKCPVCDRENRSMVCPECGFDSSKNYARSPTFGLVGKVPSVSALRRDWAQKHPEPVKAPVISPPEPQPAEPSPKKKPWFAVAIAACAAVLALGISIGVGLGGGKPDPAEPKETVQMQELPVLRSMGIIDDRSAAYYYLHPETSPVFGSEYYRNQISSVIFLDTLADAPQEAWDASEAGDGSVLCWAESDGFLFYRLYIAGEGGVSAGTSCRGLFAGYVNATEIRFEGNFHTDSVVDMYGMFYGCDSLMSLNLGGFETSNVQDMSEMFQMCKSLTSLDLRSFDTSNVRNMSSMFDNCWSLEDLQLSDRFVTTNADTTDMFLGCPAGAD